MTLRSATTGSVLTGTALAAALLLTGCGAAEDAQSEAPAAATASSGSPSESPSRSASESSAGASSSSPSSSASFPAEESASASASASPSSSATARPSTPSAPKASAAPTTAAPAPSTQAAPKPAPTTKAPAPAPTTQAVPKPAPKPAQTTAAPAPTTAAAPKPPTSSAPTIQASKADGNDYLYFETQDGVLCDMYKYYVECETTPEGEFMRARVLNTGPATLFTPSGYMGGAEGLVSHTLVPGQSARLNEFLCTAGSTGVTCQNLTTGASMTVGREISLGSGG